MQLKTAFLTVLLSLFLFSGCSGEQTTKIKSKGKGDGPGPVPTKPEKAMHDSLGQIAMAAADFVELELIIESLLRSDMKAPETSSNCPRRMSQGSNKRGSFYFTLDWSGCGKSFERTGTDCVEVEYNNSEDQSVENINKIVLNDIRNPIPVRECQILNSKYQSESFSVSTDLGLTITDPTFSDNGARFSFRRDRNIYYQRSNSKLKLKSNLVIIGDFLIPQPGSDPTKVEFLIDTLRAALTESQEKSTLNNVVTLQAPNLWLETQSCGFLLGEFLIDIEYGDRDQEIKNQKISLTDTSASSKMTDLKINWPDCKNTTRLANIRVITDYFRRFKASQ